MFGRERFIECFGKTPEEDSHAWTAWCAGWSHAKNDRPDVVYVTEFEGAEMEYVEEPRMLPVKALKVDGVRYDISTPPTTEELPINVDAVMRTAINWGRVYGAILDDEKWEDMYPTASSRFSAALITGTLQVKLSLANQLLLNELFDLELEGPPTDVRKLNVDGVWQAACKSCSDIVSNMDPESHDDTFVRFAHDLAALIHRHKDSIENEYDLNVLVYSHLNDFK